MSQAVTEFQKLKAELTAKHRPQANGKPPTKTLFA
jgi:hypothetical protein